jgi:pyruvate/2-oxoglutarate dehydrogenase complex dihydrolipoamide dehydrogenase (E3) component
MTAFDAIIIGTGQAGPFLAERLASAGQKVAIVERKLFGGTCTNTGCTPTKTMVASAHAAYLARKAADFGVSIAGTVRVDMRQVKARKDAISEAHRTGAEKWLKQMENCTVYEGHARFESARFIRVGSETITADQTFINVGGRALVPPFPGLEHVPYLTNSSMMDIDYVPERLIVVGGSYVGLEFGQMFRRFGSEVAVIEKGPRLLQREDEDVSAAIREILEGEGIEVHLNAKCIAFSKRDGQIVAQVNCVGGPDEITGTHALLAVGRRPNTDDLGLDKAGIELDQRGYIVVDDQLRTNVPGIWALGDCNGRCAFTHTAFNDFEIVAANLLDNDPRSRRRPNTQNQGCNHRALTVGNVNVRSGLIASSSQKAVPGPHGSCDGHFFHGDQPQRTALTRAQVRACTLLLNTLAIRVSGLHDADGKRRRRQSRVIDDEEARTALRSTERRLVRNARFVEALDSLLEAPIKTKRETVQARTDTLRVGLTGVGSADLQHDVARPNARVLPSTLPVGSPRPSVNHRPLQILFEEPEQAVVRLRTIDVN